MKKDKRKSYLKLSEPAEKRKLTRLMPSILSKKLRFDSEIFCKTESKNFAKLIFSKRYQFPKSFSQNSVAKNLAAHNEIWRY